MTTAFVDFFIKEEVPFYLKQVKDGGLTKVDKSVFLSPILQVLVESEKISGNIKEKACEVQKVNLVITGLMYGIPTSSASEKELMMPFL